jgi:CubicO group peptidase (beta-lactamase class C family)
MLIFFSLSTVTAQVTFDHKQFEAFAQETVEAFDLPSMTMIVQKEGEVLFSGAWGSRGRESDQVAPNLETMYAIASLSKAYTAASIGMLVDDGKLRWDDKVKTHLPWFEMHDPYVTEHLTIEDLLCHRSGLITFDGDLLWYGSNYDRKEAVKRIRHREPTYEFRSEFGYQNLMFMTAGEVIEAVSGMSWDAFVAERILKPLEMERTTSSYNAFINDDNFAKPHLSGEEIFTLSYENSGATAALNSCASDMSKWLSFWLDQGVVNGDTLLQPATVKKIWALHTPLAVGNFDARNGTHFKGYAQGWFVMDYNGRKVIHHGGGLPGFITKAVLVPEEQISIVVLTNDMSSVPTMMMYAAIDAVMGRPYDAWLEQFEGYKKGADEREAKQKEERLATKQPNAKVQKAAAYLGTYADAIYGEAVVTNDGGELKLQFKPAEKLFTGALSPWADNAFRWDHQDPFLTYGVVTFEMDGKTATGFTVELPNYDFHFDKLNFKRVETE